MITRSIPGSLGKVVAVAVGGLGAPLTVASAQYVEPRPVPMVEHEQTGSQDYRIITASTGIDAVSGGDVLLRIEAAPDVSLDELVVILDGQRVEAPFRSPTGAGALIGPVDGLQLGENTVSGRGPSGANSSRVVTNWPREGPVVSGPKEQPFIRMTERFELPVTGGTPGPARDSHCSVATRVDCVYRTTGAEFRPLPDPSAHPADLAYATTNEGRTVAFHRACGDGHREPLHLSELDPARSGHGSTGRPLDPSEGMERAGGLYLRRGVSRRLVRAGESHRRGSGRPHVVPGLRGGFLEPECLRRQLRRPAFGRDGDDGQGAVHRALRRGRPHDRVGLLRWFRPGPPDRRQRSRSPRRDRSGVQLPRCPVRAHHDPFVRSPAALPLLHGGCVRPLDEGGAGRRGGLCELRDPRGAGDSSRPDQPPWRLQRRHCGRPSL